MKRIVLIVVGALVAIAMIPIIVVSINRITQEKVSEEVVTFEVLNGGNEITSGFTQQLFNLFGYQRLEDLEAVLNGVDSYTVDINISEVSGNPQLNFNEVSDAFLVQINSDDTILDFEGIYTPQVGDVWEVTVEVTTPAQVTGVGAALLGLVPILFVLGTVFSLVIFTKELD